MTCLLFVAASVTAQTRPLCGSIGIANGYSDYTCNGSTQLYAQAFWCLGSPPPCTTTYNYTLQRDNGAGTWLNVGATVSTTNGYTYFNTSVSGDYRINITTTPSSCQGIPNTPYTSAYSVTYTNNFPRIADFTVNGTASSCTANQVYNCAAANRTMTNTSTGTTTTTGANPANPYYRVTIYNSGTACTQGTVVYANGNTTLGSNPPYTAGTFTMLNLKSLPGTNGTYLTTHTGYYLVKLETYNACNSATPSVKTALINVNTTPSPASISLTFNKGNGTSYTTDQTLPADNGSGCYGGGFNIANSTGLITYYSTHIDKINCTTGALIQSLCDYSENTPSGVSALTQVGYNYVCNSYLANNCTIGTCFKISVTVGNVCGSSTNWSYFKIDGAYRAAEAEPRNDTFALYPNPTSGKLTINYALTAPEDVSFHVYNCTGQRMGTLLENQRQNSGSYELNFDVTDLPSGTYFYRFSGSESNVGTFIKQ